MVPPKRRLTLKRIVRLNIPEYRTLHNQHCENLKILQVRKCMQSRTIRERSIPFSLTVSKTECAMRIKCVSFSPQFSLETTSRSDKYSAIYAPRNICRSSRVVSVIIVRH
jgi:hypothetical protein